MSITDIDKMFWIEKAVSIPHARGVIHSFILSDRSGKLHNAWSYDMVHFVVAVRL